MTTTILLLPEELQTDILQHVQRDISSKDFWSCLKTCTQWHRIGLSLITSLGFATTALVESVVRRQYILQTQEDPSPIQTWSDYALQAPSEMYVCQLRSLTVHIVHSRFAVPKGPVAGDFFDLLRETFTKTSKLVTFSLKFANGWDFPSFNAPAIPQCRIAGLVAALPDTVTSLELDTLFMDVPFPADKYPEDPSKHLCHQLSRRFPSLKHLRLRLSHLCPKFFDFTGPCQDFSQYECLNPNPWKIQTMTFWLHANHDELSSGAEAFSNRLLSLLPVYFLTVESILTIIPECSSLIHGGAFRTYFSAFEGFKPSERQVIVEKTASRPPSLLGPECIEHSLIEYPLRQNWWIGPGATDYPMQFKSHTYLVEYYLENGARWVQNGHRQCRNPRALKFNNQSSEDPETSNTHASTGSYACNFPLCDFRSDTLRSIEGHIITAHPMWPHESTSGDMLPCPSNGCDRVGMWGFFNKCDLEQHILDHHRSPCTQRNRPELPRIREQLNLYQPGAIVSQLTRPSFKRRSR